MRALPEPPLLAILGPDPNPVALGRTLLGAGVRWLSLRAKALPEGDQLALLTELTPLAREAGATLSVHGRPELASAAGLSAVHLARDGDPGEARRLLGEGALIGISAHDRQELARAESADADYATLSPVFPSLSKPGHAPGAGDTEGLGLLRALTSGARLPVVALGGIAPKRVAPCLAAGAAGVAVLGGFQGEAPADAARQCLEALCS